MTTLMNLYTKKHMWVGAVLMVFGLSACQSTSTTHPIESTSTASRTSGKSQTAQLRTALAGQYIRDNRLDTAQQQLELAFAADSRYAPAYDMMGVLLQQEGSQINLQKADGYFRRAIELDPGLMQAHNNYGVYLFQMNRIQEAIRHFELAGAALGYEGRIDSLENLGRAYIKANNPQKALEVFERVLVADNSSMVARIELIDLLIAQGQSVKAKQLYDETIAMRGGQRLSARLLFQGIQIANRSGNSRQQQALSQELLANYPLSDEARRLKAWLSNPRSELR